MNDTDKIIAAIFAASTLSGKSVEPAAYFEAHEQFISLMESRAPSVPAKAGKASKAVPAGKMVPEKKKERKRPHGSVADPSTAETRTNMVITNVVPNPRRPNTRANAVYAKMEAWFHKNYKNAKVVTLLEDIDDYTPIDFDWDLTRGFVTVRNAKK